jgi:purine nucleoside phosphorylase
LRTLCLQAFKQIGVTEVLQVCSVGSLVKGHIPPHSIIFPDDYIALWNMAGEGGLRGAWAVTRRFRARARV